MDKGKVTLRVLAVLIALRALTDVFKPLGKGSGLVFFGRLLTGTANTILAPLLGLFMLVLAYGMWRMRLFALPMAIAYAVFVPVNMALFVFIEGLPKGFGPISYALFVIVGVGATSGAAWLLAQRRQELT
jgi:hypothetical protein